MSCFGMAVFASGLLSFLSWKYRPRVSLADETSHVGIPANSNANSEGNANALRDEPEPSERSEGAAPVPASAHSDSERE